MEKYYKKAVIPASFSGINKIARHSKNKQKYVSNQLKEIESYALHKPVKKRFKRCKVIVGGINNQFDSDLFDLSAYRQWNDGFAYILIVIDVFSRYLMVEALKTKRAAELVKAVDKIISKRKCKNYRSDAGGEYNNKLVAKYLKDNSIKHFIARNTETKANYAERVIRTLSKKIFRYFTEKNTYKWIDVLQDLVASYNQTYHRSIGKAPADVTKQNEAELWKKLYYDDISAPASYKLNEGDVVRMSILKGNFKKERDENYTRELFVVTERYRRSGIPLYKLKDWAGDLLVGSFYEQELLLVQVNESTEYKIEKVIKKRVKGGKRQLLVHWLGWPQKFDSWLDAKLIK
jgi:hypothetical protein